MPSSVRKGKGKRPWKVVDKRTGKTVGTSKTKRNAKRSASARDASHKKRK